MNISVPDGLEAYIQSKLASGSYTSASEVVREGLRLLQEHDRERLHALRRSVNEGLDATGPLAPIEALSGEKVASRVRRRSSRANARATSAASAEIAQPSRRLAQSLTALRAKEAELRRHGVRHAAIFGSVARGEDQPQSDLDVLIEIDEALIPTFGTTELLAIGAVIQSATGCPVDVVERGGLKPKHAGILADLVAAF